MQSYEKKKRTGMVIMLFRLTAKQDTGAAAWGEAYRKD